MATTKSIRTTLIAFAARLAHRGYVVLFGVVLGVIGGVNEFFDGAIKLAPSISLAIIGASLLIAALWAAFDLVSERDRTIAELRMNAVGGADPRYAPLSDFLGHSTSCAVELSREGALTALDAWEEQTRSIVAAAYGVGEAAHVFTRELRGAKVYSGTSILRTQMEQPPPRAEIINNVNGLLGRMSGLVIRPDFDPARWQAFDAVEFRETYARPVQEGDESKWTCPWCSCRHQYWQGHCADCHSERAGDYVYVDMSESPRPAEVEASWLEEWLGRRIEAANVLNSQRAVRSDPWYFEEMNRWDSENVSQMHDGQEAIAPDLVGGYREDPRSGQSDGLAVAPNRRSLIEGEQDRYYGQRLGWMHATRNKLLDGRSA